MVTFASRPGARSPSLHIISISNAIVRLTHLVDVPGFVEAKVPDDNSIDRAVFAKLNRMRSRRPSFAPTASLSADPPPRCPGCAAYTG